MLMEKLNENKIDKCDQFKNKCEGNRENFEEQLRVTIMKLFRKTQAL